MALLESGLAAGFDFAYSYEIERPHLTGGAQEASRRVARLRPSLMT